MARYASSSMQFSFGPGTVTPMVKTLIWANVGAFVASELISPLGTLLFDLFGLRPQAVLTGLRVC